MTHEEELEFMKACGAKLSELTQDMLLGTALVMLFPHGPSGARIHAISNLANDKCQELLEEYVAKARGTVRRRESVWVVERCRQVDGVSVLSIASVHSSKPLAQAALERQAEASKDVSYSIDEQEVDPNG
mgnify:FL=1